jgi:hypothetical protein
MKHIARKDARSEQGTDMQARQQHPIEALRIERGIDRSLSRSAPTATTSACKADSEEFAAQL